MQGGVNLQAVFACKLAGILQHLRRDVGSGDLHPLPREEKRRVSAARGDIQSRLAFREIDLLEGFLNVLRIGEDVRFAVVTALFVELVARRLLERDPASSP